MVREIILPKEGLQMEEGLIVRWLKKPGDSVAEGEAVAEMETDKVTSEITASSAGVFLKALYEEGVSVLVGQIVAWLGDSMGDLSAIPQTVASAQTPPAEAVAPSVPQPVVQTPAVSISSVAVPQSAGGRIFSSPRARMRAEERGVALETVAPSGPDSLIIERDIPSAAVKAAPEVAVEGTVIPFDRIRRRIADKMLSSLHEKAQVTHTVHLDMTAFVAARETYKARGIKVSFNDLMVKACATALRQHPELNRTVIDGQMVQHTDVHVGIAVATDNGLLVPVVRNAHWLSVTAIAEESRRLIEAVRSGKLSPQDTAGGTFTVSNLGMFDIDEFQAIINPPQSAILAVGRIADRVVAVNGMIAVRPMCTVTLTYDHCVVDGAPAAQFMKALKEYCENPFF